MRLIPLDNLKFLFGLKTFRYSLKLQSTGNHFLKPWFSVYQPRFLHYHLACYWQLSQTVSLNFKAGVRTLLIWPYAIAPAMAGVFMALFISSFLWSDRFSFESGGWTWLEPRS